MSSNHMARATSTLLLLCGFLLLVTWLVTPAVSAPQSSSAVRVPAVDLGAIPPELDVVNAQVDRLRARIDRQVDFPAPSRDPFHFAPRTRALREPMPVSVPEVMLTLPDVTPPSWPTLVAILTTAEDGTRQAALSDADETIHLVSNGASAGAFTVVEISADAVVVSETASGLTTRLSLR